ncbi:MAG: hypothetical protein HYZ28_28895 [Myxococcales bacterium]|nr:hypothetical protein [Myxococcales bacterium]
MRPRTKSLAALAFVLLLAGCRTQIEPVRRTDPKLVYVGDRSCNVFDYPTASDVPDGAKNLGWVEAKFANNDEETFIALRKKVCEMGGSALSQIRWVHEAGEYEPSILRGNAWALP